MGSPFGYPDHPDSPWLKASSRFARGRLVDLAGFQVLDVREAFRKRLAIPLAGHRIYGCFNASLETVAGAMIRWAGVTKNM